MTELHFSVHKDGDLYLFRPDNKETRDLTYPYAVGIGATWAADVKALECPLSLVLIAAILESAVKKTMGVGFIVKVEICEDCRTQNGAETSSGTLN